MTNDNRPTIDVIERIDPHTAIEDVQLKVSGISSVLFHLSGATGGGEYVHDPQMFYMLADTLDKCAARLDGVLEDLSMTTAE